MKEFVASSLFFKTRSESVSSDGRIRPVPDSVNNHLSNTVERNDRSSINKNGIIEGVEKSEIAVIKLECQQALSAMRRGNFTESLCIMSRKYDHVALFHRVHGMVYAKLATVVEDPDLKERNVKNALEYARRAVELSPNSIEFAHFYSSLLLEVAVNETDYDQVILECKRALAVKIPIDPAEDSFQEESQKKIETAEGRVTIVQNELHLLVHKANLATISKRFRNLGKGGVIEGTKKSQINLGLELALSKMHCGNFTEALSIAIELRHEYANMASVHCVHGMVYAKVASIEGDPSYKQRILENAICCARRAVELSPDSLVFRSFYASLLWEMASNATKYDHVVRKCEGALSLKNPIDPAEEKSLQEESQEKVATAEGRAAFVQDELLSLLEKANDSSISKWLEDLGKEETIRDREESEISVIKAECKQALKEIRCGNSTEALRIMREMRLQKYGNKALVLRAHGEVYAEMASTFAKDPNEKQKNLKTALECARKAMELSPKSIEFSHFYGSLLSEMADDPKEYNEVVLECERALSVKKPNDPANDRLEDESLQKFATAEKRVAAVREELLLLIQKANMICIDKTMKCIGKSEKEFRLIALPKFR